MTLKRTLFRLDSGLLQPEHLALTASLIAMSFSVTAYEQAAGNDVLTVFAAVLGVAVTLTASVRALATGWHWGTEL